MARGSVQIGSWQRLLVRPVAVVVALAAMVLLSGRADAASATVTPTSWNFGNVQVDNTATKVFTLTISNGYQLDNVNSLNGTDITTVTGSTKDYDVTQTSSACYYPASKCLITVEFAPQEVGASKAILNMHVCEVVHSAVCTTYTAALTGSGTPPGKLSTTNINFGPVSKGLTTAKTVTVTVNAGYVIAGIGPSGDQSFGVANIEPNCSETGPSTCTFQATFTPYQGAAVNGAVNVTFCPADGQNLCAVAPVTLSGSGTAAATVSTTSISFGTVIAGTTKSSTVSVKVLGGWYVTLIEPSGSPFDYANVDDGCGPTGPVTCTFSATYTPTDATVSNGSVSVYVCSLSGKYCDTYTIKLNGTGKLAGTVSPTALKFGDVKVGSTGSATATISWDAGWQVAGVRFDNNQALLSTDVDTACNPDAPGTSCTLTATFAPVELGYVTANMIVRLCTDDRSLCTDLKPVPVTGTGTAPATQSPTLLTYTNVPVNSSATMSYTVRPDVGWYVNKMEAGPPSSPFLGHLTSNCTGGSGTACTVDVVYSPTAAGKQTGYISVEICNATSGLCFAMTTVKATGTAVQTATTTTLKVQTLRPNLGYQDHLTATVSPGVDGGTVYFEAGGQQICAVAVAPDSTASCVWSPTHTGTYKLQAVYGGDAAFKGSSSSIYNATAVLPPP